MNHNRTVYTGLKGWTNLEILNSVIGQLSDGKWENSPAMSKYWRHASVAKLDNDCVVIYISDDYGSGFLGHSEEWIKAKFASWVKAIVQDELDGDGLIDLVQNGWDRTNSVELGYLGSSVNPVTVADAYRAYDVLKGRSATKNTYAKVDHDAIIKANKAEQIAKLDIDISNAQRNLELLKSERDALRV